MFSFISWALQLGLTVRSDLDWAVCHHPEFPVRPVLNSLTAVRGQTGGPATDSSEGSTRPPSCYTIQPEVSARQMEETLLQISCQLAGLVLHPPSGDGLLLVCQPAAADVLPAVTRTDRGSILENEFLLKLHCIEYI